MSLKTDYGTAPSSFRKRSCLGALLGASALLLSACTLEIMPQKQPVTASTYMVATANPLASQAAADILGRGGNAVDAAIAGQMVLAVVEPQASGLGGGSAILFWEQKTGKLSFYDGLASAPASVPDDYTRDHYGKQISHTILERTGRVVGIPGTLRTLALLHKRYGKLPWADLFTQAIAMARSGFPMPGYLHLVLTERPDLALLPDFSDYFDTNHHPLPKGTLLHNPALADTLARIAQKGAEEFYGPDMANRIAHAVAKAPYPGKLTAEDFANYKVRERAPLCVHAFGRRICSAAPPVAGGLAVLQQLALLDRMQIGRYQAGSVEAAHLLLEASRLAEADRRKYAADPDFVPVATSYLLSPAYLDSRAREISVTQAAKTVKPGTVPPDQTSLPVSDAMTVPATTHLSVQDSFGNALSFTTTINLNFGADIKVDGIVLNDAITNFATHPVVNGTPVANALAPGKRPITTMAPTIVFGADNKPEVIIGAGGGARIIDSVVQSLVGYLAWGQNIRTAIEQPRIGAQNRAEELEHGTSAATLAPALRQMGHTPKSAVMNAAVQAITRSPSSGLQGWGDPHRDGVAIGK